MNQRIFRLTIHTAWNNFKENKTVFSGPSCHKKKSYESYGKVKIKMKAVIMSCLPFCIFLPLPMGHICVNRIQCAFPHFNKNSHQN